ncbi:MAG TPA: ribonuclease III [Pseudonocardia sp.]
MGDRATRGPESDRSALTAQLGVELDTELLTLALTHRSYAYEHGGLPTNERLEFLGDSVLGVIVTERLYRSHPDLPEGQLAKLRASVVNMHALASVARELGPPEPDGVPNAGLGAYLYLGRGEELTGGRGKASILADATEALIGAVYLAHGLEIARDVVERLFDGLLRAAPLLGAGLDWKTSLQELTASAELGVPEYRISEDGPDHLKTFTATAVVAGRELGTGMGRTKKEAEQKAAQLAWRSLSEGAGSANSGTANSGSTNSGTTNSGSVNSTDPDSHSATEPGAPDS